MSDVDKEQKTEQASEKRRKDLRDEGKVPKSVDVVSTSVFIACAAALFSFSDGSSSALQSFTERMLTLQDVGRPLQAVQSIGTVLRASLLPVLTAGAFAGLAVGVAQTRGFFSFSMAAPKPERLNPLANLKNVIPSKDSLFEIGKAFVKMGVVGWVVYMQLRGEMPRFAQFATVPPNVACHEIFGVVLRVVVRAGMAFIAIAAADYGYALWRFNQDAMMSKQEVKDEHKQEEGDPHNKARQRSRMRQMSKNRAVGDVRNATVLVTNPTHYAIALRYVPEKDAAPILLAKGVDDLALKMRKEARKHGIPIIENRPLARALYAQGKAGRAIPVDLYQAAAGVIAHVLRLKATRGGNN